MARYRFSIDAGAFLGARFISVPSPNGGKPVQGLFIPAAINGIDVRQDFRPVGKANQSGLRAFLSFTQRSVSNAYCQAVKDRLVSQGEGITPYNVPAWSVCYAIPEEKRLRIRSALKARVLADNPALSGQEDVKGTPLAAAISRLFPFQMGDSYLIEEQKPSGAPAYADTMAPSVMDCSPVAPQAMGEAPMPFDEDVPF